MTHKLIHTPDYLLVVDNSEIKEGDWCLDDCNVEFKVIEKGHAGLLRSTGVTFVEAACKKIISHLPLSNSPILEGVNLLPPLEQEDDVERLIKIEQEASYKQGKGTISWYEQEKRKEYYNKAKEKFKYTEEDMKRIYEKGYSSGRNELSSRESDEVKYSFIQSLLQPKMPVGFECETITMNKGYTDEKDYPYQECEIPKTTTNSQGQIVWVGKYIY